MAARSVSTTPSIPDRSSRRTDFRFGVSIVHVRSRIGPTSSREGRGRNPLVRLYQRAAALVERTERLVARHGGDQLVEIPLTLGLLRLLHLEQIHVMDHAAVDA